MTEAACWAHVRRKLHAWFEKTLATLSQKSATAKAILYAFNRWQALMRYCDDGRIEIDNNAAERSLRCVALGRKNFLFAGSDTGGDRAAAFYSLIGTAKLNGHNPEAFLREVLTRSPNIRSRGLPNFCRGICNRHAIAARISSRATPRRRCQPRPNRGTWQLFLIQSTRYSTHAYPIT